ncbi:MAG TPA: ribosomal-processing cysteine protease Prp [Bacilli bacterium]
MINVEAVKNENQQIIKIKVSGHSGYDDLGKDIVCSAVSTAMYVSLGLLEKFNSDYKFTSDESKPIMVLEVYKNDELSNAVLDNLVDTLKGIALDYQDFLKIDEIRR